MQYEQLYKEFAIDSGKSSQNLAKSARKKYEGAILVAPRFSFIFFVKLRNCHFYGEIKVRFGERTMAK